MMKNVFILGFVLMIGLSSAEGMNRIEGTAKGYEGNELVFYTYSDRISLLKKELFRFTVGSDGRFSVQCDVKHVSYVFSETGVYHMYFYIEPGSNYDILIPERLDKTPAQELNPYFAPLPVHIGIKGMKKTDLNYLVLDFDYWYNQYVDESLFELYTMGSGSDVDTFINEIDAHFSYDANKWFKAYRKYKYAGLRYIAYQRNRPEIAFRNYTHDSVMYDCPAYMELFNELYKNFFDNLLSDPVLGEMLGARLFYEVHYGHSISNIKKLFSVMMELKSNQFRELVILKGIHDAFYNVNYAWAPLLLTLDSLCIVTQYPEHKIIGQNIADKVLSMTAGTVAPPFALPDKNGDTVKLASYRNQFVYLNFINTQAYPCQQQLELLQTLFHKHNQYFKIVSIVTDSDVLKAKLYIEKKAYSWDFLFTGGDMQVVDFYKVKAFPSYFLVEPNGLLLMSPAPDPLQGFEKTFFSIIKD